MQRWSLGTKLFTGLGALLALTAGLGFVSVSALSTVQTRMDEAAGPISQKLIRSGAMLKLTQAARAAEKGAIVSTYAKDHTSLENYRTEESDNLRDLAATISELRPLLVTDQTKAALNRAAQDLEGWQHVREETFRLLDAGNPDAAVTVSHAQGKVFVDRIVESAETLATVNTGLMTSARDQAASEYAEIRWLLSGVLLFALAVAGVVIWMVRGIVITLRNVVSELAGGGAQVAAASSQIASTSQTLSQGSSEQAASLEEVSASMEEMNAMTKSNAGNSAQAMAMMAETVTQVDRSNAALTEMVASMSAIKASSEKVARINHTIDEIAFQTNILALNAAVEAARAGEAGMSFAVVADEVRSLAQRSAVAAKDTAALIEEAIADSSRGADKLEQVSAAVRAITESTGKVKGLVDEVNEASRQQTNGIGQVTTAVNQVSMVTQTTAATAEESAAAAEELSAQSESVARVVKRLQVLVDGTSHRIEIEMEADY